jgi:hypothetical protein
LASLNIFCLAASSAIFLATSWEPKENSQLAAVMARVVNMTVYYTPIRMQSQSTSNTIPTSRFLYVPAPNNIRPPDGNDALLMKCVSVSPFTVHP